jgi:hypothetical protein
MSVRTPRWLAARRRTDTQLDTPDGRDLSPFGPWAEARDDTPIRVRTSSPKRSAVSPFVASGDQQESKGRRLAVRCMAGVTAAAAVLALVAATSPSTRQQAAKHGLRTSIDFGAGHLPVVWDSCLGPIEYRVNLLAITSKAERVAAAAETATAFDRISAATGLRFRYAGTTDYVPRTDETGAPVGITVAFVRDTDTDLDVGRDDTFGVGGSTYQNRTYVDRAGHKVVRSDTGFVVIDHRTTAGLPRGRDSAGATRPNLLVHELGHVVGLEHVPDPHQLMHTYLTDLTPAAPYGAGDVAGFKAVGAGRGCLAPQD